MQRGMLDDRMNGIDNGVLLGLDRGAAEAATATEGELVDAVIAPAENLAGGGEGQAGTQGGRDAPR